MAHPVVEDVVVYRESPGRLGAGRSVAVIARVRGFVREIGFDDGQFVNEGDVLFGIEPEEFQAAVAQAEAALASAEASRDLATTRLERIERAMQQQAASDIEVAEATAERDAAEAAVSNAQAALDAARLNLSYTEVKAPFGGRVSEAEVDVGGFVGGAGGESRLAEVTSLDPIYVYWDASERDLLAWQARGTRLRRESGEHVPPEERITVKLRLADGTEYENEGYIDYLSPQIDERTGTIRVRARIPNPEFLLFPGQFARVLLVRFQGAATLVPESAIVRDIVGPHMLALGPDNVIIRKDIELGPLLEGRRIVQSGLSTSDKIVTAGVQRARVGLPVDPQQASAASPTGGTAPKPDPGQG